MLTGKAEIIFGGSFDPIHCGHVNVIQNLRDAFPELLIRLIPCSIPPLKTKTNACFLQRKAMLTIATKNIGGIEIDLRESLRGGISYTIDTLKELKVELPNKQFILVLGADAICSLKDWYQVEQLANHCQLLVVNRPDFNIENERETLEQLGFVFQKSKQKLVELPSGHYSYFNMNEVDISSTQIREKLEQGACVNHMIPDEVFDYIQNNSIYQ